MALILNLNIVNRYFVYNAKSLSVKVKLNKDKSTVF